MGFQTVLTHEFAGVFAKRDPVAERDPLRIAGLLLEIEESRSLSEARRTKIGRALAL